MISLLLCCICSYCGLFTSATAAFLDDKQPLYFSLSMTTSDLVPGVNRVLQAINNDSMLLAGYTLQYVAFKHQVSIALS